MSAVERNGIEVAEEIPKAGCIVLNDFGQVLVVNERNGDWGLPKGHKEDGESLSETAVRETREETGYDVAIEQQLDDVRYVSSHTGEPVCVRYYYARPVDLRGPGESPADWVEPHIAQVLVSDNLGKFILAASEIAAQQNRSSLSTVAMANAL